MIKKELDLSCFSYLAAAKVLNIDKYPKPNYGAEVFGAVDALAADGPMVAIASSHLGLRTGFIGNAIGDDGEGKHILYRFQKNNVRTSISVEDGFRTPFIVIISDKEGKREWFPYIPKAVEDLKKVDLDYIVKSSLAYIDFYTIIEQASLKAVEFASSREIPIFLNLGGSPFTKRLEQSLKNRGIVIIQTNLDESLSRKAIGFAKRIFDSLKPEVSIVTIGSKGAVAYSDDKTLSVPAYPVYVKHVHGAGAAFSAAYAFSYLNTIDLEYSLEFACALGSMNCTVDNGFDTFSVDDIKSFINDWRGKL